MSYAVTVHLHISNLSIGEVFHLKTVFLTVHCLITADYLTGFVAYIVSNHVFTVQILKFTTSRNQCKTAVKTTPINGQQL